MKPVAIVLHHTAGNEDSAEQLRNVFRARFGVDYIGYHYCVSKNGEVWKDLRDDQIGIHNNVGAYNNTNSLGISVVGTFTNTMPNEKQMATLTRLLGELKAKYGIANDKLFGHRDFKSTECPGNKLYSWLVEYKKGANVDAKAQRIDARADANRYAWKALNGVEPGMDSIRNESTQIENGKLSQEALNNRWMQEATMHFAMQFVRDWYRTWWGREPESNEAVEHWSRGIAERGLGGFNWFTTEVRKYAEDEGWQRGDGKYQKAVEQIKTIVGAV